MLDFQIRRNDLRAGRIVDVQAPPLAEGAARLCLDSFALTSNNVTYAAMGEGVLGYWDFFPGPEGFGRLPVWGFATVAGSRAPGVTESERFYGYFPLSESLDVLPARQGLRGFMDSAPHRRVKAAVYNQYLNTAADPAYDPAFEPEQALFRPLYATGWWAADCVMQGELRPRSVVISSASAKTALGTAHQLRRLGDARLVALTSAANAGYVRETGLYHATLAYEAVGTLAVDGPAVYLDFLGREALTAAVHRALGTTLARSILVGATDWDCKPGGVALPATELSGPRPEFFFVPDYAVTRLKDHAALGADMVRDLRAFYRASRKYVSAQRLAGSEAILQSWSRLVGGEVPPREGLVLSFH